VSIYILYGVFLVIDDFDTKEKYAELESEVEDFLDNPDARPVASQTQDWTISTLRDKYERGQLNLQPHYQRQYVWQLKPELPSRLIESLLLNIPIPPLYFIRLSTGANKGKSEVVDGQQRLTTLIKFIKNEFKLEKLQKLSSLNGKCFRELPEQDQEKILDASIRSIIIDSGENQDLQYEIFERLNRGAMALNEQEIRNCVYRGNFCDLLAELENDANWRKVKGTSSPEGRFAEREMILRFFAFSNRLDSYKGNLKRFLNDYMGDYAPKDPAQVTELGASFRQTMQNVHTVFGEHAGRLYTVGNESECFSGFWEKKFSISALDIQAAALIGFSPAKIEPMAHSIREIYKFYLVTNPQVRTAISSRPAGTEATKTRWLGFKAIVQELFASSATQDLFKEPLFEAKVLYRIGYFSAAGAIAGVTLEKHLKEMYRIHNVKIVSKPTISPLNGALRSAGIYDQTQHSRIQVLNDIRNRCSHSVPNPASQEEVWELIEGVSKFLKEFNLK
ncbi:MAG: DUF262 domain-containing protein, partial [Thiothrix sp.]